MLVTPGGEADPGTNSRHIGAQRRRLREMGPGFRAARGPGMTVSLFLTQQTHTGAS